MALPDMRWHDEGNCVNAGDVMHPKTAADQKYAAKTICNAADGPCPVRLHCLAYALQSGQRHGVWGGLTERQRNAILKRNPRVPSWRERLGA